MFGGYDPATGKKYSATRELVRMAVPRRVFTNSHLDYVAETAARIVKQKHLIPGFRITREPALLRHFNCELEAMQPQATHA
jgi:tryptophanase